MYIADKRGRDKIRITRNIVEVYYSISIIDWDVFNYFWRHYFIHC